MFVFSRKRFALILSCIFLSFTFVIVSNNVQNRTFDITQVSAIPVNEKVIVLDAGHRTERTEEQ